jgi:predicted metalloprotease with PDZ domain
MVLVYPKWVPGEHGPTGPVVDSAGLVITANGQQLVWTRDDVDMYAFHITVPAGTTSVEVAMDFLATAAAEGFSSGASSSEKLALLSWNTVVLYPAGSNAAEVQVEPSLSVPRGWKIATALDRTSSTDQSNYTFQTLSLEQLVDSPVMAGEFLREIPITPDGERLKHFIDLAADGAAALAMNDETIDHYKNLVAETGALFGARHYNHYNFLVTLSDYVAHFGLEHHQSSDDRIPEKTYIDPALQKLAADLLPHEFVHSWNGKYRRPAGLATPNYQEPMKGELLWVYEGLTQYLGMILAPRSGLEPADLFHEKAAVTAAYLDIRNGRRWRDLEDTATAAQLLYGSSSGYQDWRRSTDYYDEGFLCWLDADTTIRQLSGGKKSLDDFTRAFHGGQSNGPELKPYTFDDLVNALNQVQPNDWRKFWLERLHSKAPHAPLGGIENGGYRLVYNSTPSEWIKVGEGANKFVDARFSIGAVLTGEGNVMDVMLDHPAAKAGLAPGMRIAAVNGRRFTPEGLQDAIANSTSTPMELIVESAEYFKTLKIDYNGGAKYPHLERVEGKPALLDEIIKPHARH